MITKSRAFKMFALILSCSLFITSLVVNSVSRFVALKTAHFNEDDHLNYTVNTVIIVKNQEELFAAINQGYTYIQLEKTIENPLIITQKTENLDTDLILDLNGIEIQRNGYDPILNVREGVRLTIIDTSDEQTGGLYNPVGSVFNVNGTDKGGTLTILAGEFESGPRYSEYYSYNDKILNDKTGSLTSRTKVESEPQSVKLFTKNGDSFNLEQGETKAPIIKSYPEKTGDIVYEHGNLYFDNELSLDENSLKFKPDTYCYYRSSDGYAPDSGEIAQSDWYYTYYVEADTYDYVGAELTGQQLLEDDKYVKITIYGYENVIKQADEGTQPVAALQMSLGTIDIQDGGFFSYFGVKNAACVNAVGGNIKIKTGRFSSRVPNATSAVEDSVGVKEDDKSAFTINNYFNNYEWSNHAVNASPSGNIARKGEAYCILNGGDATVSIESAEFYSSNNNIVSMGGGKLSVGGGTFTKQISNGVRTNDEIDLSAIYMLNGSLSISNATCNVISDNNRVSNAIFMKAGELDVKTAHFILSGSDSTGIKMENGVLNVDSGSCEIDGDRSTGVLMQNGELTVTDIKYDIVGDDCEGIIMQKGVLTVSGGSCSIAGDNSYGIYSTVSGDNNFTVTNTSFTLTNGTHQTGIYSENGKVTCNSTSNQEVISTSGAYGIGIHVLNGGSVECYNYSYSLTGDNSIGILADTLATGIIVENGDMNISGASTYGIKSSITGTNNFTVTDLSILMSGGGEKQTGIYSANGKVTVKANSAEKIQTSGVSGKGIHVLDGGSVDSFNYSYSLTGDNSIGILADTSATGIIVENGDMNISGASTYGIKSSITGTNNFTVTDLSILMSGGGEKQTGIYSANGKVTVKANSAEKIQTSGVSGKGIHVLDGGSVDSFNYSYSLTGDNSIGIDAESDAVGINVENGKMTVTGNSSFGIRSYIDDKGSNDKFNVKNLSIEMTNGTRQTGIFSQNGRVNLHADSKTTISIADANGKGIHVSTGGSVITENYSYHLMGATSHGIYSTAGLVEMSGGNITLNSNQSSYGIYAFSNDQISVDVTGATIDVGYSTTTNNTNKTGTNRASVGVFLATNNINNKITLTNTNVRCYEVGILVDGGSLEVYGSGQTNDILTRKASSIIVKGGGITFDETCKYNITSSTTRNNNTTNSFTITLPTINENQNAAYANTDGVYVSGGNFISNGNVNITHAGLRNNIDAWRSYIDVAMTSFAVRVEGGSVTLNRANITSSVGGGVMCNGGNVTLGTENSVRNDITVKTTGTNVDGNAWYPVNQNSAGADGSWNRYKTRDGGSAIEIHGGNLVVYEGTYEAAYGDGIYLKTTDNANRATVDIHNGSFTGLMTGDRNNEDRSGPAGSYGVKVYGYSLINIYNGEFNGQAGTACVGGASNYNYTDNRVTLDLNRKAEVYVYRGHFGNNMLPNDGFMIYDNSKVIFGAGNASVASVNAITCRANLACLSVNWFVYNQDDVPNNQRKSCDVRIYYGTYESNRFAGWNKGGLSSETHIYNTLTGLTDYSYNENQYQDSIIRENNNRVAYYQN